MISVACPGNFKDKAHRIAEERCQVEHQALAFAISWNTTKMTVKGFPKRHMEKGREWGEENSNFLEAEK